MCTSPSRRSTESSATTTRGISPRIVVPAPAGLLARRRPSSASTRWTSPRSNGLYGLLYLTLPALLIWTPDGGDHALSPPHGGSPGPRGGVATGRRDEGPALTGRAFRASGGPTRPTFPVH